MDTNMLNSAGSSVLVCGEVFARFIRITVIVIAGCLLSACTKKEDGQASFTLATGVSLISTSTCSTNEQAALLSVDKKDAGYVVNVRDEFDCDLEMDKPFLTVTGENRATLVLTTRKASGGFNSACHCPRSISISISDRLEPGDTLYILNGHDVIGHVSLP